MSLLGIYFGPKVISIVETKGKKILNNIQIPNSAFFVTGLDDKVPEEIKIVALFKERLRKEQIETKDAVLILSGKDLIVRTFSIPILPPSELHPAINFEAKKYIPFKIEELVTSFQTHLDRFNSRYAVLFVGIKKDILEKYFSIANQVGLRVKFIEYSAFSVLRLVELSGLKGKGIVGVISIDTQEGDEADFTVLDNGFPLFSCDIKFGTVLEDTKVLQVPGMIAEKLKSEIRISLDYYNHKFPAKKIKQIFLIGNNDARNVISPFVQELGLVFKFVDPTRAIGKEGAFSLSLLKAYSCTLSASIKSSVKVNLLQGWEKTKQLKSMAAGHPTEVLYLFFSDLRVNLFVIGISVLLLAGSFGLGIYKQMPLRKEIALIKAARPNYPNANAGLSELDGIESKIKNDIEVMETAVKKQLYVTPQLTIINELIPEGMWLDRFNFICSPQQGAEFTISGKVFLGNSDKEFELISSFFFSLKNHNFFKNTFKVLEIKTVSTDIIGSDTISRFVITGHS